MTQFKRALLLTAAVTSAISAAEAKGMQATLKLPPAKTAHGQALSPYAINKNLSAKRYKVQEMYRKGSAYQVKAIGPSGSKVEMMVDGRSGAILGLNVLSGLAAVANALFGSNHHMHTSYTDDRTPFGAVVPSVVYSKWQSYGPRDWGSAKSDTIPVQQGYAPYGYAVPYTYVHTSPQGRSFAVAPPSYRGYSLQDSNGRAIQAAQTRADAADTRAALASERASDSDYRAALAAQDARDANQNADDMTRIALEQETRANQAEQQNAQLQAQLDSAGTSDQAISNAEADSVVNDNAAPPPAEGLAPEDTSGTDALDDYENGNGNGGRGNADDATSDDRAPDNSNQNADDNNQNNDDQNADDNNQNTDDQNADDNNQNTDDQNANDDNQNTNDQNADDDNQSNDDQNAGDDNQGQSDDQGGDNQGSGDDN